MDIIEFKKRKINIFFVSVLQVLLSLGQSSIEHFYISNVPNRS